MVFKSDEAPFHELPVGCERVMADLVSFHPSRSAKVGAETKILTEISHVKVGSFRPEHATSLTN